MKSRAHVKRKRNILRWSDQTLYFLLVSSVTLGIYVNTSALNVKFPNIYEKPANLSPSGIRIDLWTKQLYTCILAFVCFQLLSIYSSHCQTTFKSSANWQSLIVCPWLHLFYTYPFQSQAETQSRCHDVEGCIGALKCSVRGIK